MIMSRMPLVEVTTMLSRSMGNSLAHCHRKEFLRKADLNSADAVVGRLMRRFPLPWSFLLLCFPFFIQPTNSTSFNWKRWTENRQMTIRQCMQGSHTVPRSAGICLGPTVWSGGFNLWSSRNGSATRPLLMSLRADRSLRILRELTREGVATDAERSSRGQYDLAGCCAKIIS